MTKIKHSRPMLACSFEPVRVEKQLPVYVQPKLDGIRCRAINREAISRSSKRIPNLFIQEQLGHPELHGLDGELTVGSPVDADIYNRTQSAVMTASGEPDFTYHVFDSWALSGDSFGKRWNTLRLMRYGGCFDKFSFLKLVPTQWAGTMETVEKLVDAYFSMGYEGAIIRRASALYKNNRATPAQGQLVKVKAYEDMEGTIVECVELMHNDNPAHKNELGYTVHTSHKANLRASNMLGAFILDIKWKGSHGKVRVGSGFTRDERIDYWNCRATLIGEQVKFKYIPAGSRDAPRNPIFLGFRSPIDT